MKEAEITTLESVQGTLSTKSVTERKFQITLEMLKDLLSNNELGELTVFILELEETTKLKQAMFTAKQMLKQARLQLK